MQGLDPVPARDPLHSGVDAAGVGPGHHRGGPRGGPCQPSRLGTKKKTNKYGIVAASVLFEGNMARLFPLPGFSLGVGRLLCRLHTVLDPDPQ